MRVLLPPSETKHSGGGNVRLSLDTLAHSGALTEARKQILTALTKLSRDTDEAAAALKVGVKARNDIAHNLQLTTSATMPAIERYTGVLFDALDVRSLPAQAVAWVHRHVQIQSALFGLVAANDMIPAYRLSAGSRLTVEGVSHKKVWRKAHQELSSEPSNFTLDLRSKDYAALAPVTGDPTAYSLNVVQRQSDGTVRALNHFNKAAKGDLVRRLAVSDARITGPNDFIDWADGQGLALFLEESRKGITLVTDLGAPGGTISSDVKVGAS